MLDHLYTKGIKLTVSSLNKQVGAKRFCKDLPICRYFRLSCWICQNVIRSRETKLAALLLNTTTESFSKISRDKMLK